MHGIASEKCLNVNITMINILVENEITLEMFCHLSTHSKRKIKKENAM